MAMKALLAWGWGCRAEFCLSLGQCMVLEQNEIRGNSLVNKTCQVHVCVRRGLLVIDDR